DMATEGVRTGNIRLIGEAATLSAVYNQNILPKIALTDIINVGRQKGGIGVNIAHSGTIIGMMVEKGFGRRFFDRIAHYVPRPWKAYCVSVVDGGVRHEEVEPAAVN
ncbi:MAG TPA: hypothetical protein VE439_09570, partial [Anaerolineae bacterium]|nr:hypothetical protein [Anaerolineae bacterium]